MWFSSTHPMRPEIWRPTANFPNRCASTKQLRLSRTDSMRTLNSATKSVPRRVTTTTAIQSITFKPAAYIFSSIEWFWWQIKHWNFLRKEKVLRILFQRNWHERYVAHIRMGTCNSVIVHHSGHWWSHTINCDRPKIRLLRPNHSCQVRNEHTSKTTGNKSLYEYQFIRLLLLCKCAEVFHSAIASYLQATRCEVGRVCHWTASIGHFQFSCTARADKLSLELSMQRKNHFFNRHFSWRTCQFIMLFK